MFYRFALEIEFKIYITPMGRPEGLYTEPNLAAYAGAEAKCNLWC